MVAWNLTHNDCLLKEKLVRSEIGDQGSGIRDRRSEIGVQRSVLRSEMGDRRSEIGELCKIRYSDFDFVKICSNHMVA